MVLPRFIPLLACLWLLAPAPTRGQALERLRPRSVSVETGAVRTEGALPTAFFGLAVEVRPLLGAPGRLRLEGGGWISELRAQDARGTRRDFTVAAGWVLPLGEIGAVTPLAGAGLGLHFRSARAAGSAAPERLATLEEAGSGLSPSTYLEAGARLSLAPRELVSLELRGRGDLVRGAPAQVSLRAALRLALTPGLTGLLRGEPGPPLRPAPAPAPAPSEGGLSDVQLSPPDPDSAAASAHWSRHLAQLLGDIQKLRVDPAVLLAVHGSAAGLELEISPTVFAEDGTRLSHVGATQVALLGRGFAGALRSGGSVVVVVGYTQSDPAAGSPAARAQRRATAVIAALAHGGAPPARASVEARSADRDALTLVVRP